MQVLPYPDGAQIPVGAAGGEELTRPAGIGIWFQGGRLSKPMQPQGVGWLAPERQGEGEGAVLAYGWAETPRTTSLWPLSVSSSCFVCRSATRAPSVQAWASCGGLAVVTASLPASRPGAAANRSGRLGPPQAVKANAAARGQHKRLPLCIRIRVGRRLQRRNALSRLTGRRQGQRQRSERQARRWRQWGD